MILSGKNSIHASHWGDELSLFVGVLTLIPCNSPFVWFFLHYAAWHFCLNSYHLNVNYCFNVNPALYSKLLTIHSSTELYKFSSFEKVVGIKLNSCL